MNCRCKMRSFNTLAHFLLILLGMMTTFTHGDQHPYGKAPVAKYGEDGDAEPIIKVDSSGEDFFNTNDTSRAIVDESHYGSQGNPQLLENCHEETEKSTPLVFRKSWDSAVELEALDSPAAFVVIKDGGDHCNSSSDCLSQIHSLKKMSKITGCDLRENFYVGGDGKVYEGRGWGKASYWHLNGLGKKSITVQFLGSHDRMLPGEPAIEAFETLVKIGQWLGQLPKSFRITSFKQVLMDSNVSTDMLSQNPTDSERWISGKELSNLWEYVLPRRLRFVFRKHWNASKPTWEFATISTPVDYVAVSEGGDRCYNRSDCISKMLTIQAEHIDDYGDLLDNFYIGDGGEVYEGRGWDSSPHWYIKGLENKYISVRILGSYPNELPTPEVINSFKNLVQNGLWLGKISPTFRIFSLRQIYNQSVLLGNPLLEIASKWSIWSSGDFIRYTPDSFGLVPFMGRSEWNAVERNLFLPRNSQPIEYVTIGDGGGRCFSVAQCSNTLKLEQNQSMAQYGDLLDNFYVGDDGVVYEGRGWDTLPLFNTPFFNGSLITVKFLGSFQSSLPSRLAWLAFLAFLDAGIASGKISPDYKLYSFRHIYNDSSLLGDEITRLFEGMRAWDGQLSQESEDDRVSPGILPIYELDLLSSRAVHKEYSLLDLPVEYVVVGDSGDPCFTHESCMTSLNERKIWEARNFNNFAYNFYVGGNGMVYVGCGWNSTCYWHVRGVKTDSIFVTFLGNFQNSRPSPYALLAFNRLLQFGIGTGKLAADHKIISLRQLYPNSSHASVAFSEIVKSWGRWSQYQALSQNGEIIPFGPSSIVPLNQWSARGLPRNESRHLKLPASYLIILDADESCLNIDDCVLRIQDEQRRLHPQVCNSMENFYINEDGRMYEGGGWSQRSELQSIIFNIEFITVVFFGKFRTQPPSSKALAAFDYFFKQGIMEGNLKPNFHIFSLRQFIPSSPLPGEALDKYIRTLDKWSNDPSPAFVGVEISTPREWGSSKSIRRSHSIFHPLKYVYVREGGSPCSSKSECIDRMETIENSNDEISENFYIGGTGEVFEGVGWFSDAKWEYQGWQSSISVQFLGTFETSVPTAYAQNAFTYLCEHGVGKGYIDPNYKMLFIPDGYESRKWVGSKFKELIKSWKHWVPNI